MYEDARVNLPPTAGYAQKKRISEPFHAEKGLSLGLHHPISAACLQALRGDQDFPHPMCHATHLAGCMDDCGLPSRVPSSSPSSSCSTIKPRTRFATPDLLSLAMRRLPQAAQLKAGARTPISPEPPIEKVNQRFVLHIYTRPADHPLWCCILKLDPTHTLTGINNHGCDQPWRPRQALLRH